MSKNKITLELSMSDYGVIYRTLINERNRQLNEGKDTDIIDDVLIKVIDSKPKEKRERKNRETR